MEIKSFKEWLNEGRVNKDMNYVKLLTKELNFRKPNFITKRTHDFKVFFPLEQKYFKQTEIIIKNFMKKYKINIEYDFNGMGTFRGTIEGVNLKIPKYEGDDAPIEWKQVV